MHLTGNHARTSNDSWMVLTGCRQGAVPRCADADGPAAARRALDQLVAAFGRDRVFVELWDHGDPLDRHRNDALATLAGRGRRRRGRHQQRPLRHPRAPAARHRARGDPRPAFARRDGRLLPASPLAHLRSAGEQAASFRTLAGRGGAHASRSRSSARSTCASPRPTSPISKFPRPHRHGVVARAHAPRRRRALPVHSSAVRAGATPDRVRARRHRAARLPGLLPRARRHHRVLPQARTSTARVAAARPTARCVTRSASPRPTPSPSVCCSSASSLPSATAPPTSTSTSSTSAARR